ncbi:hypothetical protein D3C86_1424880 [compost metagenome]
MPSSIVLDDIICICTEGPPCGVWSYLIENHITIANCWSRNRISSISWPSLMWVNNTGDRRQIVHGQCCDVDVEVKDRRIFVVYLNRTHDIGFMIVHIIVGLQADLTNSGAILTVEFKQVDPIPRFIQVIQWLSIFTKQTDNISVDLHMVVAGSYNGTLEYITTRPVDGRTIKVLV